MSVLGGYHSAQIILKSIDYHDIMSTYGKNPEKTADLLQNELLKLIALNPDCIIICCNTLHKYYDMIKDTLDSEIPVFHAVDLVAKYAQEKKYKKILLLATKFTMEAGFFAKKLTEKGIEVTLPNQEERHEIQEIHNALMNNTITQSAKDYFRDLILKHKDLDAVVLGCTEFPLVVNQDNSILPILNPVHLQTRSAVTYALETEETKTP